jgi:hypothetical protein
MDNRICRESEQLRIMREQRRNTKQKQLRIKMKKTKGNQEKAEQEQKG